MIIDLSGTYHWGELIQMVERTSIRRGILIEDVVAPAVLGLDVVSKTSLSFLVFVHIL